MEQWGWQKAQEKVRQNFKIRKHHFRLRKKIVEKDNKKK